MRVSLQRLEGFYWVAKMASYAAAARNFPYPISQPGIHQQVKALERELEVTLFARVSRDSLKLTTAGEALFAYCAPFLEGLPQALEAVKGQARAVTIEAGGLVMRQLIAAWMRRLRHADAAIRIELKETTAESWAALETGAADLWVDFLPAPPRLPIASQVIGVAQANMIVPKFHRQTIAWPETLRQHAFIGYPACAGAS